MTRSKNTRNTIATVVVLGFITLFFIPPTSGWLRQRALDTYDFLIWDTWYQSAVDWNGRRIVLPSGKYRWLHTKNGDLVFVSRENNSMVISLRSDAATAGDDYLFVTNLCKIENKCKNVSVSQWRIGAVSVDAIEYIHLIDGQQHAQALIRPKNAKVVIDATASAEAYSEAVKPFVEIVVPQLQ